VRGKVIRKNYVRFICTSPAFPERCCPMADENSRSWIESTFGPPALSLTTVRWVAETEETDDEGDTSTVETEMFDVVGEQHRLDSVVAAGRAIEAEESFLPARFWLTCDNANEHDDQAVRAYALAGNNAYHVGFLPRVHARLFRDGMQMLAFPERTLEILGCITQGKSSSHPNARLYLPVEFAELIRGGYAANPTNQASWLQDTATVTPRPWRGRNAEGFTDVELCKIYCRYAKTMRWNSLPHRCEEVSKELRHCGSSVPEAMEDFVLDPSEYVADLSDWRNGEHYEDAKEFARAFIRSHLEKIAPNEDVKAKFKHTSVGGKRGEPGQLSFLIYWKRDRTPIMNLATIELTRTGPGQNEFSVTNATFNAS